VVGVAYPSFAEGFGLLVVEVMAGVAPMLTARGLPLEEAGSLLQDAQFTWVEWLPAVCSKPSNSGGLCGCFTEEGHH
jgi:hypothetical protein